MCERWRWSPTERQVDLSDERYSSSLAESLDQTFVSCEDLFSYRLSYKTAASFRGSEHASPTGEQHRNGSAASLA
jgi:hypothetical protein